jgi:hypothetical protein
MLKKNVLSHTHDLTDLNTTMHIFMLCLLSFFPMQIYLGVYKEKFQKHDHAAHSILQISSLLRQGVNRSATSKL